MSTALLNDTGRYQHALLAIVLIQAMPLQCSIDYAIQAGSIQSSIWLYHCMYTMYLEQANTAVILTVHVSTC